VFTFYSSLLLPVLILLRLTCASPRTTFFNASQRCAATSIGIAARARNRVKAFTRLRYGSLAVYGSVVTERYVLRCCVRHSIKVEDQVSTDTWERNCHDNCLLRAVAERIMSSEMRAQPSNCLSSSNWSIAASFQDRHCSCFRSTHS